jgi:hypothetical protein
LGSIKVENPTEPIVPAERKNEPSAPLDRYVTLPAELIVATESVAAGAKSEKVSVDHKGLVLPPPVFKNLFAVLSGSKLCIGLVDGVAMVPVPPSNTALDLKEDTPVPDLATVVPAKVQVVDGKVIVASADKFALFKYV